MKKAIRIAILLVMALMLPLSGCGTAGDPILDDLYSQNVLPGTDGSYGGGSPDYYYEHG